MDWTDDDLRGFDVIVVREGDPAPLRSPQPPDDAPLEVIAEWLRRECTASVHVAMSRKFVYPSTLPDQDEPPHLFCAAMARVRARVGEVKWERMQREATAIVDAAKSGDHEAQMRIVSVCGPYVAPMFAAPNDVQRVRDVADALWLRSETAAWGLTADDGDAQ